MLKAQIVGNLGSDPELNYNAEGKPRLRFTVASNGRVRNQSGEWEDQTTWVRCVVFGARADSLAEHLKKGMRVFVDGRLEARPWLDRRNEPQAGLEVVATEVEFVSSREDRQPVGASASATPGQAVRPAGAQGFDDSGSLPF